MCREVEFPKQSGEGGVRISNYCLLLSFKKTHVVSQTSMYLVAGGGGGGIIEKRPENFFN